MFSLRAPMRRWCFFKRLRLESRLDISNQKRTIWIAPKNPKVCVCVSALNFSAWLRARVDAWIDGFEMVWCVFLRRVLLPEQHIKSALHSRWCVLLGLYSKVVWQDDDGDDVSRLGWIDAGAHVSFIERAALWLENITFLTPQTAEMWQLRLCRMVSASTENDWCAVYSEKGSGAQTHMKQTKKQKHSHIVCALCFLYTLLYHTIDADFTIYTHIRVSVWFWTGAQL